MTPSPIFADSHLATIPKAAAATAITAMAIASVTTLRALPSVVISSTMRPAITGVATVSTAPITDSTRNTISSPRCGRANENTRRSVAR